MALITLRVLDGADRGRIFARLPTPVTIGREEGNSVQLNDERVSRFHLKIQEDQNSLVLADLESTNGTKVNGEDTQLRILRHGDIIHVGRSVLLFGSREEIARRLALLRGSPLGESGTMSADGTNHAGEPSQGDDLMAGVGEVPNLDLELNWSDSSTAQTMFRAPEAPELPTRLGPGQAAQLCELLEFMHIRLRELIATAKPEKGQDERISIDHRQWQNLIDLHAQTAKYLRQVGNPPDELDLPSSNAESD